MSVLQRRQRQTGPGAATFNSKTVPIVSAMIAGSLLLTFFLYCFVRRRKKSKAKAYFDKRRSLREVHSAASVRRTNTIAKEAADKANEAMLATKEKDGEPIVELDGTAAVAELEGLTPSRDRSAAAPRGASPTGYVNPMHASMVKPQQQSTTASYQSSKLRTVEMWVQGSQESLQLQSSTAAVVVTQPAAAHARFKPTDSHDRFGSGELEKQLEAARATRDKLMVPTSGFFDVEKDGRTAWRDEMLVKEVSGGGEAGYMTPRRLEDGAERKLALMAGEREGRQGVRIVGG